MSIYTTATDKVLQAMVLVGSADRKASVDGIAELMSLALYGTMEEQALAEIMLYRVCGATVDRSTVSKPLLN